jgi:hypothetical protein
VIQRPTAKDRVELLDQLAGAQVAPFLLENGVDLGQHRAHAATRGLQQQFRAFTIRAWSRRTLRQTCFHGMECQPGTTSGSAPASVAAADISACLPVSVGQGSLVTKDPREVSRLSPWGDVAGRLNPYLAHYRPAFACSLFLYPPPRKLALRLAVPVTWVCHWGDDGLTTFRRCHGVG